MKTEYKFHIYTFQSFKESEETKKPPKPKTINQINFVNYSPNFFVNQSKITKSYKVQKKQKLESLQWGIFPSYYVETYNQKKV